MIIVLQKKHRRLFKVYRIMPNGNWSTKYGSNLRLLYIRYEQSQDNTEFTPLSGEQKNLDNKKKSITSQSL